MKITLLRFMRALAWLFVTIITLYALVCGWVNWSGSRMYREAAARIKKEGESLDFRETTAAPIPDAENFCAIPALNNLALDKDDESSARRSRLEALKFPTDDKLGSRPKMSAGATLGASEDLKAWRSWLRDAGWLKNPSDSENAALDVLDSLSAHAGVGSEIARGLERPFAQWTPHWRTRELPEGMLFAIPLPHYNPCQNVVSALTLRTWAAAQAKDAAKAHESLQIMVRFNEANANEPFLIGLLVSIAGSAQMTHALWEVCDAQVGSISDFSKLEMALDRIDYKDAMLRAWRGELASAVEAVASLKNSRGNGLSLMLGLAGNGPNKETPFLLNLLVNQIPRGYFDANAAVLIDYELKHILRPSRDQDWKAILDSASEFQSALTSAKSRWILHPYHFFSTLTAPATLPIVRRVVYAQCFMDQAIIACALERHRLEVGSYPGSLTDLKLANGKPLPNDALSGMPVGYRKTDNGKYALWSVGFDGKDDGGKRGLDEKDPTKTRFSDLNYKGDWVWDFPAQR